MVAKKEKEPEPKESAVFTFGRFNPPTKGHGKLIDKMKSLAKTKGSDHHVFASPTKDDKKNPLTHKEKIGFLQSMFPGTNICPESGLKTPIDVMKHLQKLGYKRVTLVVGEDRVQAMQNLLHKYNGKDYKFDHINVISAGERNPDSDDVDGSSGSKMRDHALKSNFKEFTKGVPDKKQAKALYSAVRKGLKMNENNALFLVGGPGSGKDLLIRTVLTDSKMELPLSKLCFAIQEQTELDEVKNNQPLIVNGNADQVEQIKLSKLVLENMGYKTAMLYVYTSDEQSKVRNDARIVSRVKTISESVRKDKYSKSIEAISQYQEVFGDKFVLFNNSHDLTVVEEETKAEVVGWIEELRIIVPSFFEEKAEIDQAFHALTEGKESEYNANKQLANSKKPVKKVGNSGLNDFFSHREKMAKKQIKEEKKKSKNGTKAASPPSNLIDSRVDGGAVTQVFGYTGESVKPKALNSIKEALKPKINPEQIEVKEIYEDWGLSKEDGIYEGRAVSLNRPWKRSDNQYEYSVYVKDGDEVVKVDFKKGRTSINEGSFTMTNRKYWESYDVQVK